MSVFEITKKSIPEIKEFCEHHKIDLRATKYEDIYLLKFTQGTDVTDPQISHLKGLMFKTTGQLVSMTYPVPVEFKDLDSEHQEAVLKELSSSEYTVREATDGTLLRLQFIEDSNEWVLSTNSKEDANDAYWMNGVSFAKQFESVKENVPYDKLDKNRVYLFVMVHPLNVIVVNHKKSKIYHVATYDRTTGLEVHQDLGLVNLPLLTIDIDEIISNMKDSAYSKPRPIDLPGYMVIVKKDNTTYRYRFEHPSYTKAKQVRGHSNDIEYHLLALLKDVGETEEGGVNDFLAYYPLYNSTYSELKERIHKLSILLYRQYGQRYKDHTRIRVHPRHNAILAELPQKLFKDTLKPIGKTVQFDDINQFLYEQPSPKLLYLLRYIHFPDRVKTQ